jgi:hypothetical protein
VLATLNDQSMTDGGNFTVVATGSAPSPTLFLLDNNFPGSLGTNQAAVRFVNLAPGELRQHACDRSDYIGRFPADQPSALLTQHTGDPYGWLHEKIGLEPLPLPP